MTQTTQVNGDPRTLPVLDAAREVHRLLGCGFLESAYQEALAAEFKDRAILFQRQVEVPIFYKGRALGCGYRADFVGLDRVLVEVKAVARLTPAHEAQVIHYLKATGLHAGLLLNFGRPRLEYKRFISASHTVSASSVLSAVQGIHHESGK